MFDADPTVEGLVLVKHGIFSFGADARQSYERMIALVTLAEARLAKNRKAAPRAKLPARPARVADVAPIVRGACSLPDSKSDGAWKRFVLEFRGNDAVMNFVNGAEVARYGQAGVVTPDHNIRIKNKPLVVAAPEEGDLAGFGNSVRAAVASYGENYKDYFARNNARVGGIKTMLDPAPRVVLVPGVGLFGLGRSKKDARSPPILRKPRSPPSAMPKRSAASSRCRRPICSMSNTGRWSRPNWAAPKSRRWRDRSRLSPVRPVQSDLPPPKRSRRPAPKWRCWISTRPPRRPKPRRSAARQSGLKCDVTDAASVRDAFARVAAAFGGVDIAVSNAGAAWQGRIGEVDEAVLRESFELNFYGHQRVAQAAVGIMRKQGTGGCLLFNVSKQAVNPGPNFGPYGLPKAATLFLVRQYALDYGSEGIRANAVNADRIRSGLLTEEMIASRSKLRGVSEEDYMRGNLLGREVAAEDVAQAFLAQALALKTTADVTTVDGGNIAAALR